MLEFLTPKPPVPTVPKVSVYVSNNGIFASSKQIICSTVIPIYSKYKILAVSFTFGTNLSTEGPGDSAFIKCMVEPPIIGRIAKINTNTPIPPIQCVKLRLNRFAWLKASTSDRMLAPVVVKPEIVSNKAST